MIDPALENYHKLKSDKKPVPFKGGVDLTLNNLTEERAYGKVFFEKILNEAAKTVGKEFENAELSVNLVGEQRIKELNQKYCGKNQSTDVLSFPLHNKIGIESIENAIISLGDIFICLSVAKKDASKEGRSLDSELAFLTVHGFLHLLGYDHEKTTAEKKKMFTLQDKILSKISF